MKVKSNELTRDALNWAVTKTEGFSVEKKYCTEWELGGPIIERELIRLDTACNYTDGKWKARIDSVGGWWPGETPLIAAMRCYVASKLGDEVDLPEGMQP